MITNLFKNQFNNMNTRERYALIACIVNIGFNFMLFVLKFVIGIFSRSIAITTDGVDNFIDAILSGIMLLGFKISNKPADEKHPFGYGRIEYILTLIFSIFIFIFGIILIKNSFMQILSPKSVNYSNAALILLIVSIIIKIFLAKFNKAIEGKIKSPLIKLNFIDCITDIISTSAVIVSLVISNCIPFNIDGVIGLIESTFIIYTGFESAKSSINLLLGSNIDYEFMERMKNIIYSYKDIHGIHNLVIHDYGAGKMWGSIHLEINWDNNIIKVDKLIEDIYGKFMSDLDLKMNIHVDLNCKEQVSN